jgi:hypothetical protein
MPRYLAEADGTAKARLRGVFGDAVAAVTRGEHVLLDDKQIATLEAMRGLQAPGGATA